MTPSAIDPDVMITVAFGLGVVAFALLAGIVVAHGVRKSRRDAERDE